MPADHSLSKTSMSESAMWQDPKPYHLYLHSDGKDIILLVVLRSTRNTQRSELGLATVRFTS